MGKESFVQKSVQGNQGCQMTPRRVLEQNSVILWVLFGRPVLRGTQAAIAASSPRAVHRPT